MFFSLAKWENKNIVIERLAEPKVKLLSNTNNLVEN